MCPWCRALQGAQVSWSLLGDMGGKLWGVEGQPEMAQESLRGGRVPTVSGGGVFGDTFTEKAKGHIWGPIPRAAVASQGFGISD